MVPAEHSRTRPTGSDNDGGQGNRIRRYAIAVGAVAGATLFRMALNSVLGSAVPYITFFPAVFLAAMFGGFVPGLISTVLGAVSAWYFFVPAPARAADVAALALFLTTAGAIAFMQELLDRSRRQAAEAGRREQEQELLYKFTLAAVSNAVVATDAVGKIRYMNPAAEELTGWKLEQAKDQPVADVVKIAGGGTDALRRLLNKSTAPRSSDSAILVNARGSEVPVEQHAGPIRNAAGETIGAVLVMAGIADRKRAESALRESERKLRTTLDSITDAFVSFDSEWRFTYVNPAAERILNRSRQELMGRNHWAEYPELRGTALEENYRRAVRDKKPVQFEYENKTTGSWFELSAYPNAENGLSVYFHDITLRKTAEEQLRQSKREAEHARDLLHTTLASIGDCVICSDREGRITFMNAASEALLKQRLESCAGKPVEDVFAVYDDQAGQPLPNPIREVLAAGAPVEMGNHAALILRDGARVPVEDSAAPIREAGGDLIGAILVFRDTSERRRSSEALMRSEERLRLALEAGRIGVWDWNIATDHIEWSDRVYEIHGIDRGTDIGRIRDYRSFIFKEDAERVAQAMTDALEGNGEYNLEFRIERPDGAVRWIATSAEVFRSPDGKPIRMLGATYDVTARRAAQEALRESEERLALALDAAQMGTWDWNLKTNETVWSDLYFGILGLSYETDSPSYDAWRRAVHPSDIDEVEQAIQRSIRERKDYRGENRVVWPDESVRWVETRSKLLMNESGEPVRMIGVVVDVTERKRVEESLLRANEELQHFAYAASHDLQEPLRTITTFSQLLTREFSGHTAAVPFVQYIVEGTTRMRSLIQGMLELTQAGGVETAPLRPVSVAEVLQSTLRTLQTSIEEAEAEIVCDELPEVLGDPAQIAQVFQNLISNAIKYRRPSVRPVIRISSETLGGEHRFAVRDNGLGFGAEQAERIFAPFRRLHGREIPGAGIGLALCRRIIARHQGAIWADGGSGDGATFYFTLPAVGSRAGENRPALQ